MIFRTTFFLSALTIVAFSASSQSDKTITVGPGNSVSEIVTYKEKFSYPNFIEGTVSFKDGVSHNARLNYNLFTGQLQFINRKGDTLELVNEKTIKDVTIGKDSFFYDNGYYRLLKGNGDVKLAVQQRLVVTDKQKIGAFGQRTSGAGIETVDRIVQVNKLTLMENIVLSRVTRYYLGNRFNKYVPFNRKGILKTFSSREKEIRKFLDESAIDFNKQEDLIRVLGFLQHLAV